ncbi:MAG TPA: DEAD/DEAH box helicase, partial [Chryseosolibacter sp.]|nr:DEAD/DEAH box helicase [Chryseosolibacter sp.]
MQEEIISAVIAGHDTLALLPTGGGKSVCFQVPALLRDGLCIVVTPLIALMKDQVEQLRKKTIPAVALHSGMSRH